MAKKHTGQCACGAIKFGFDNDPEFIADCFCLDCRKASGGVMATFFAVPADDFTLYSGNPKPFRYIAQSGKSLDRNFCPECGSRVFTTNLESFPDTVFVQFGSLDNPDFIKARAEAGERWAGYVAVAIPQPISVRPLRIEFRWHHPRFRLQHDRGQGYLPGQRLHHAQRCHLYVQ